MPLRRAHSHEVGRRAGGAARRPLHGHVPRGRPHLRRRGHPGPCLAAIGAGLITKMQNERTWMSVEVVGWGEMERAGQGLPRPAPRPTRPPPCWRRDRARGRGGGPRRHSPAWRTWPPSGRTSTPTPVPTTRAAPRSPARPTTATPRSSGRSSTPSPTCRWRSTTPTSGRAPRWPMRSPARSRSWATRWRRSSPTRSSSAASTTAAWRGWRPSRRSSSATARSCGTPPAPTPTSSPSTSRPTCSRTSAPTSTRRSPPARSIPPPSGVGGQPGRRRGLLQPAGRHRPS